MDVMNFNNVSLYVVYISGTRKKRFPKSFKKIYYVCFITHAKNIEKNKKKP